MNNLKGGKAMKSARKRFQGLSVVLAVLGGLVFSGINAWADDSISLRYCENEGGNNIECNYSIDGHNKDMVSAHYEEKDPEYYWIDPDGLSSSGNYYLNTHWVWATPCGYYKENGILKRVYSLEEAIKLVIKCGVNGHY